MGKKLFNPDPPNYLLRYGINITYRFNTTGNSDLLNYLISRDVHAQVLEVIIELIPMRAALAKYPGKITVLLNEDQETFTILFDGFPDEVLNEARKRIDHIFEIL